MLHLHARSTILVICLLILLFSAMMEPISAGALRGQTRDDPPPPPSSTSSSSWPSSRLARNNPDQSKTFASLIWPSNSRLVHNSQNQEGRPSEEQGGLLTRTIGRTTLSQYFSYSSRPGAAAATEEAPEVTSIPSICLENPDDPVCDKLHWAYYRPEYYTRGGKNQQNYPEENQDNVPSPSPRGGNVPTVRYYPLATLSPTKDMCYGNMEKHRHGKFCHSEMPSVSYEPSEQPTHFPTGTSDKEEDPRPASTTSPSESPSAAPSFSYPSESPSASPSLSSPTSDLDDDFDHFEDPDSEDMAPTNAPAVTTISPAPSPKEGDLFSYDENGSSEDTNNGRPNSDFDGTYIAPPSNGVRLKLYWQQGYYWQEESIERKWCMRCENNLDCQVGETLYLGDCTNNWHQSAFFTLKAYNFQEYVQIQVLPSVGDDNGNGRSRQRRRKKGGSVELCLERSNGRHVTLQRCMHGKDEQLWRASQGSFSNIAPRRSSTRFELSQNLFGGIDYCLTNHHHPKYGEPLEMYTCTQSRTDETSFWNAY